MKSGHCIKELGARPLVVNRELDLQRTLSETREGVSGIQFTGYHTGLELPSLAKQAGL